MNTSLASLSKGLGQWMSAYSLCVGTKLGFQGDPLITEWEWINLLIMHHFKESIHLLGLKFSRFNHTNFKLEPIGFNVKSGANTCLGVIT